MTSFLELVLGSTDQPGQFEVRVVRSAAGETPVRVFSLDTETLIRRRRELENAVLASSTTTRRALPESEHAIREVGEALFAALFGGPVYGRYEASLATAQERGEPLRVVLHVDAPELAALPWEAMFDPEHQGYLCQREPLVRQVPAPSPVAPLPVAGALRILAIVAGPEGLPHLDAQEEQRRLMEALAEPLADGRVTVRWATTGTWRDVQSALLNGVWHVVHFIGHGGYNAETDEGVLAMVGPDGRKDLVGASRFAVLLSEAEPSPRLIVLNSCGSGESGTRDLFSSTGAALARSGVSAVVGMQYAVTDQAALEFSRGFYTALAGGRGVDQAVRSGRVAIRGISDYTLEWVTPLLYLRGDETHLFDLSQVQSDSSSDTGEVPPAPDTPVTVPTQVLEDPEVAVGLVAPADAAISVGVADALEPRLLPRAPASEVSERSAAPEDDHRDIPVAQQTVHTPWIRRRRRALAVSLAVIVLAVGAVVLGLYPSRGHAPPTHSGQLLPGAELGPNKTLYSPNGQFRLVMQASDGNLVIEESPSWRPLSAIDVTGHPRAYAWMQPAGNLVVYPHGTGPPSPGGVPTALWYSSSGGAFLVPGALLVLQNSGDLVVARPSGHAILCAVCGQRPAWPFPPARAVPMTVASSALGPPVRPAPRPPPRPAVGRPPPWTGASRVPNPEHDETSLVDRKGSVT